MNNIQKAFKNKAKMGLRMANGGVLEDPFGFNNVLSNRNQRERQTSNPLEKIDGAIAMGDAVEGSNLTMSDKAALGIGTTSADASALRQKTSALSTLREGMLQQPGAREEYDAWQNQNGLRVQNFADGGVVDPVEALLARTKANYGVSNTSQPAAQAAPQPTQQPAPQPAAPAKDNSGGLFGKAMRGLRGRAEAANFANGGIVKLSGPGTGTSDDIPMKVNKGGQSLDVNVSNGEALAVLPAKTAQNPDAVEAVNEIIYQTNGKPPKGLRAGGHYAEGSVFGGKVDEENATPVRQKVVTQPASFGATPEQKASFAEKVNEFKQARGLRVDPVQAQPPVAQPAAQQGLKPAGTVVPMPQKPVSPDAAATAETREAAFAKAAGVDPEIAQLAAGNENRTAGFSTLRDATQFNVPKGSGGGVITGAADKNGLRRAMVVLPNGSPTQVNPNAPRDIYGNDMTRTNDMKRQLAEIQRQNTDSDLASGLPFYQQRGLRALAADKMRAETDAARSKGGASALDVAKFNLDVAKFDHDRKRTDNMQGNADRESEFKDNEAHTTRVDNLLKSWATGEDGKLDNQKYAYLQKYAGQFKRGKGMSSDEHLAELMDNFAVDSLFEQQGRHWSSAEGPSAGEAVLPKTGKAGMSALLDARMPGQQTYVDPLTKRTIYQSDVVGTLSPRQQKILQERLAKQR